MLVKLKWIRTHQDLIVFLSSESNKKVKFKENQKLRLEDWIWSIWQVLKDKRKPKPQVLGQNKAFTSTCLSPHWVKSLVHWQVPIQLTYLTETQNLQDFFNNHWEEMQRQSWLQTLVQRITTMNKQSVHYVMLHRLNELRTSQRLMKIQKMRWFVSINRKSKD